MHRSRPGCDPDGMKQYPADFRDRLLHALDAGLARAEATRTFGVTDRTIRRWQQRRRETGTVAPTPGAAAVATSACRPKRCCGSKCARIPTPRWSSTGPLGGRTGIAVSAATMSRALGGSGCPSKKVPDRRRARRGEAAAWRGGLAAVAPQRCVFLDETATPTTLTRLRARAPRGERAIGRVPRKRWHSVTLLASITTAAWARRWCSRAPGAGEL